MLNTIPRMTTTGRPILSPPGDTINRFVGRTASRQDSVTAPVCSYCGGDGYLNREHLDGYSTTRCPKCNPAPLPSLFEISPAVVSDVRADLNELRDDSDDYYTDEQVSRALTNFVRAELDALIENVGTRFFEQSPARRWRFLGAPAKRTARE